MKDLDVLSLGELNVEFFHKKLNGIFSELADISGPYPSGAAAIFIDTMAKLGARTGYIGTVGHDEFGDCLVNRLKKDKVNIDYVYRLESATTGVAFRTCYSNGSRKFIYHIGNAAPGKLCVEHIDERFIGRFRWLHISGNVLAFSKSARDATMKAVDIAHSLGIPISLDPNLRLEILKPQEIKDLLEPVLRKTYLFLPSKGEIRYITGNNNEDKGAEELLRQGIGIIARKEGLDGSSIFTKEKTIHTKPFTVKEIDATGCGDAYGGAFVYGLMQGWEFNTVGEFANAVGAITATRYGPMEGIESLEEVQSFIKSNKNQEVVQL